MLAPGPDGRYGLGIMQLAPTTTCPLYGHIGAMPDWSSVATVTPRSGTSIVVLLRGATGEDAASGGMLLLNTLRNQDVLRCA